MAVHLINELLNRLPEDCEERVHRAITEFNKLIRNQLMKETSLRLRGRRGSDNGDAAIPIRVEPGFPSALESLLQRAGRDEIEALIALFEDDLERLSSSAGEVTRLIDRLLKIERDLPECDEKYTRALADSIEVAKRLLERVSGDYLAKSVFAIQDDILGNYKPTGSGGQVTLFWMAIGIGAKLLNVRIEELTAVILIHELAHGFTHLGKDADNESWETDLMFKRVDRGVVEGLAHFYTDVISETLGDTKSVGVHETYLRLRRRQRGLYRVHDRWVANFTSEVVRSALLEYRRHAQTTRDDFERALGQQSDRLNATPREPHERVKDDIRRYGPLHSEFDDLIDDVLVQAAIGSLKPSEPSRVFASLRREWEIGDEGHLATAITCEWNVALTGDFRKTTGSLDRAIKGRLFDAMNEIAFAPLTPRGDTVKRLTGDFEGLWRYRVGDYRLIYHVDRMERRVVFLRCEPRSSVYDN